MKYFNFFSNDAISSVNVGANLCVRPRMYRCPDTRGQRQSCRVSGTEGRHAKHRSSMLRLFSYSIIMLLLCFATMTAHAQETFNLATGTWSGGTHASNNCTWDGTVITVNNGANITITGSVSNQRRIAVAANATASITLNNVTIAGLDKWRSPLSLNSGATVNLTLLGTNTLTGGGDHAAISALSGTTLTIDGTGKLTANGGNLAAGIGGNYCNSGGNITIAGAPQTYIY